MPTGSIRLSKRTRSEIGRAKAYARHHGPGHPSTLEAQRRANFGRLADYVAPAIAQLAPLTNEERETLAKLLEGATTSTGGGAR